MPKNLVVCCDGTANEFAADKTNVIKLYSTLVHEPGRQQIFYHPGIGTMEHPAALTDIGRKVTRLLGMAIGYGLENDIRDAYVFLMRYFEPGDRVYLFGFSRGAYTARAVASLLRMYGLIRRGHESLVPYAIRLLMGVNDKKKDGNTSAAFKLANEFKAAFCSTPCAPWFAGVWDTVSSVGWISNPLKLPFIANNPDIHIGRHAVSIDEHRAFFRTNLWRADDAANQDLKQVWFPGVHCDVGGGYPEAESGLSKVALEWMLTEAVAAGLIVNEAKAADVLGRAPGSHSVQPGANADPHESLTWKWYIGEFVPKRHYDFVKKTTGFRANLFRRRTIPEGSLVHESAFERAGGYADRLPKAVQRVATRRDGSAAGAGH
jgi:uncharacterized protein (DUF2235 family)